MKRRAPSFPYAFLLVALLCLPALLAARSHGPDEIKSPESVQAGQNLCCIVYSQSSRCYK